MSKTTNPSYTDALCHCDELWNDFKESTGYKETHTAATVDNVNHPPHYIRGNMETINVIEAFTEGLQGMEAVCTANVIKYICRWKYKNGLEDLRKAKWYLEKLINTVE